MERRETYKNNVCDLDCAACTYLIDVCEIFRNVL